jgi:hypothetical protein
MSHMLRWTEVMTIKPSKTHPARTSWKVLIRFGQVDRDMAGLNMMIQDRFAIPSGHARDKTPRREKVKAAKEVHEVYGSAFRPRRIRRNLLWV